MSFFINDIKKICKNRIFLLTFALLFVCTVIDPLLMIRRYEVYENPYYWWMFMNNGTGSSVFNTLYWLIPALLTGMVFFDERNSAIYGVLITKGKRSSYFISKGLSLFLVTLVSLLSIFLLNLFLTYTLCPANIPIDDFLIPNAGSFAYPLFQKSPLAMAIVYNVLHALALALLSVLYLCLQMVLKIKNKYLAILIPSLLMYAINFAIQITGGFQYSLTMLLQPMAASASTEILSRNYLVLVFGCLALANMICFIVGARRNRDVL